MRTMSSTDDSMVHIQEVAPRDGLQNEAVVLTPEVRADLINRLAGAGLRRIQIGSFVNPRLVPQLADTGRVWRLSRKNENVRYSVLTLNDRGLDQALEAGVPHVEIFVSASETHSQRNVGMGVGTALNMACGMIRRAKACGLGVTAGVMCAYGCYYEGPVPKRAVLDIVAALERERPNEIGLADTPGLAEPHIIRNVTSAVRDLIDRDEITLHLHDTNGYGSANVKEALSIGVRMLDSSVGGLGGCPFVPGAKGNVSTESVVEIAESLGFATGISAGKLIKARKAFESALSRKLS